MEVQRGCAMCVPRLKRALMSDSLACWSVIAVLRLRSTLEVQLGTSAAGEEAVAAAAADSSPYKP